MNYFTDSVLRAPTIGCMLMCLLASVIGTFVVLQRKSLIGETLSHACYPGVILALFVERAFFQGADSDIIAIVFVLMGAFLSCIVAMYFMRFIEKRFFVPSDAALSVTLSFFFGIGYAILSGFQQHYPTLYKELQAYLFGQAATLRDIHVYVLAILTTFTILLVTFFFRPIKAVIFDPIFSHVVGIKYQKIESLLFTLTVLAIVVGIRSIGVVLMSAMLIFPAASSGQFTKRLSSQLCLGALFGLVSGYLGVVLSHDFTLQFFSGISTASSLPTGPTIVMVAAVIFLASIFFAPKKGLFMRLFTRISFFLKCDQENILKAIWKNVDEKGQKSISYEEIKNFSQLGWMRLKIVLTQLISRGFLRQTHRNVYEITPSGMLWGRKIVRLHRLWEVYLVEYCKIASDRVHPSAEVMEHIITPEIEAELTFILHNPTRDPHMKLIPPQEGKL